jgi:serine/threonine protein kinase/tetratricopeptide (TPR) repeat protein
MNDAARRWRELQDLLDLALTAPPEQRAQLLAQHGSEDPNLLDEAQALLRHLDALPENLPASVLARDDSPAWNPDEWIGREIGAYRLEQCIGRGGSSLVFRARRRDEFAQQVAIKLLHGVGAPARRFLREREFLAALSHPGIARLFDAGTTADGVPFLVLELVEGRRWDEVMTSDQPPLAWRLERFARICDAVAHAHQHLLVHRDIKPANLILDAQGEPHLLDFGIATLLGDAAQGEFTRELGPAMTPAYASPEQVRGEPASTATDVHALGVLLYETLTGDNPFRDADGDAAHTLHAIATREPPPPSRRLRELRRGPARRDAHAAAIDPAHLAGDLDLVVATALDKDPARRYASARQLGDDVRAVLAHQPIRARPPTLRYLARRFASRHKLGVALAAFALASLLAAVTVALWQSRVAQRQGELAEQRLADVRRFVSTVLFDYHDGIHSLAGSLPMQQRMVADALGYLETLQRDAGDDASLWLDLAEGYIRIGDVQGNPYLANLGDFDAAETSYARAASATESLQRAGGRADDLRWLHARIAARRAALRHQAGDLDGAAQLYRDSLARFETLPLDAPIDQRLELATTLDYYGDLLGRDGQASLLDREGAQRAHAQARAVREELQRREPDHPRLQNALYHSTLREGEDLAALGDMAAAEAVLQRALVLIEALHRAAPEDAYRRREVAQVYSRLAGVQAALGRDEEAIASALQSFRRMDAMAQADPDNDTVLQGMTAAAGWAARFLIRAARYDEAEPIVKRQIDGNLARLRFTPDSADIRFALSLAYRRQGELSAGRGDYVAAIAAHRDALALQRPLASMSAEYALGVSLSLAHVGRNELAAGRIAAARASYDEAAALLNALMQADPDAASFGEELADIEDARGASWIAGATDCRRALAAWDAAQRAWTRVADGGTLLPPQQSRRAALQAKIDAARCAR